MTYEISLNGRVQGVGFRPFVYKIALRYGLKGEVFNHSLGVSIRINATKEQCEAFVKELREHLPPLASIESLTIQTIPSQSFQRFSIVQSQKHETVNTVVLPDTALCKACQEELFDPQNRRFEYPFINCTDCGVRYSMMYQLPYDRDLTSMKFFSLCSACQEEYDSPLNHRYHAQPIGCWECGPRLYLLSNKKREEKEALKKVVDALLRGKIVAIKGVGGYHLMCDAFNEEAIVALRERKRRPKKPFAVMLSSLEEAERYGELSLEEKRLLCSKERPIVLVKTKENQDSPLAHHLHYGLDHIGMMLPYTALHLLLLKHLGRPVVVTSANRSGEPLATTEEEIEALAPLYDLCLSHNRDIVNGCDDSVVMVVKGKEILLRGARGYRPLEITLPFTLKERRFAYGANQKSSIAFAEKNRAILSPYLGGLETLSSLVYYRQTQERLKKLYGFSLEMLFYDAHPQYESTKEAQETLRNNPHLKGRAVFHHYAHILCVMAEHQLHQKVLGVAFDGTGYGDDGTLWGGEWLVSDFEGYERVAHLDSFRLLGGKKAIEEPWRIGLSLLFGAYEKEEALSKVKTYLPQVSTFEQNNGYKMWERGMNAPLSSSMGRLFDGVASLLGLVTHRSYEGESGLLLASYYSNEVEGHYPFSYENGVISWREMLRAMLEEEQREVAISKFFHTIIEMIAVVYEPFDMPLVATGGVFQNRVLLDSLLERFPLVYLPQKVSPNDEGIALGQLCANPFHT